MKKQAINLNIKGKVIEFRISDFERFVQQNLTPIPFFSESGMCVRLWERVIMSNGLPWRITNEESRIQDANTNYVQNLFFMDALIIIKKIFVILRSILS